MKKLANIFEFFSKNQSLIQSVILWIMALAYLGSVAFWYYAIPAMILSSFNDIVTELRKLNKQNENGKS